MKLNLRLILSFLSGIVGIILLISNLIVLMFLPVADSSNVGEIISKKLRYILGSIAHFLFIVVIIFSLFGIFLGIKSVQKKIAVIAIILNSVNLLLSLFIAWLLFGLARGM